MKRCGLSVYGPTGASLPCFEEHAARHDAERRLVAWLRDEIGFVNKTIPLWFCCGLFGKVRALSASWAVGVCFQPWLHSGLPEAVKDT